MDPQKHGPSRNLEPENMDPGKRLWDNCHQGKLLPTPNQTPTLTGANFSWEQLSGYPEKHGVNMGA